MNKDLMRFFTHVCMTLSLSLLSACGGSTDAEQHSNTSSTSKYKFITATPSPYVTFESGQVRPLALSVDGTRLFAINTPDNHLEVFTITPTKLVHTASVPVGIEPVAVAARDNGDVWVVNHLSDSISIIDTASPQPFVKQTILVGDEPRDIVFAGSPEKAFITTAHRGQHSPYSPTAMPDDPGQVTLPGIGRADVWVFDANNPGHSMTSSPITILTLFTDTPRALAVSADRKTVYAAGFHTGNKTAIVGEGSVCNGGVSAGPCTFGNSQAPGGLPAPNADLAGNLAPEVGLIVKQVGNQWLDERGTLDWSNQIRFNLPDTDVFKINANLAIPVLEQAYSGIGTILYNMITNPVSGKVYVSNTEAVNHIRFEGTRHNSTFSSVVGHLHESRITVIDPTATPGTTATALHLNKHIDYTQVPSPAGIKQHSLATPMGMAISPDGNTLYVAAFGSAKIGVFNTSQLESDSFIPSASDHINMSGGGPTGLVLNTSLNHLYALNRFNNSVSIINTTDKQEIYNYTLHNPEPPGIKDGRPFLYDASLTSSNGEASCSSCHVFADLDSLAWDLGDPEGIIKTNLNIPGPVGGTSQPYHPMKGPMTTQSLRGLANHGPMHWRGDRTAADVGGDPMDEAGAFKEFNVAFEGLLGRDIALSTPQMDAFTNFILQVNYPPNPNRPLDNSKTPAQQRGADFFFTAPSTVGLTCNTCHVVDPAQGFFGSDGRMSFEAETQEFKIPHLRNMYQKVGMFGMPENNSIIPGDGIHMGDQIRGFGFIHDGSTDTLLRFHSSPLFNFPLGEPQIRDVEQFMHAMDSNHAPIVGQQVTLSSANLAAGQVLLNTMISQMSIGNTEVVAKANLNGKPRGWFRQADGTFQSDDALASPVSLSSLLSLAQSPGGQVTFTATPVGTAIRIGVDRDNDLILDHNDNCPDTHNPDQLDDNNDGIGNACPAQCLADFDNDGDVDTLDTSVFSADFGRTDCLTGDVCEADFDMDNDVDTKDTTIFAAEFGRTDCPLN